MKERSTINYKVTFHMSHVTCLGRAQRGFALLISIIIAAIVLTISASIVNNALKEVILASTARESLESLYSADSGNECFLYWDNIRGRFGVDSAFENLSSIDSIECRGITMAVTKKGTDAFSFWMREEINSPLSCTYVTKQPDSEEPGRTIARSWGFNTCNPANTRRVDRAFEIEL